MCASPRWHIAGKDWPLVARVAGDCTLCPLASLTSWKLHFKIVCYEFRNILNWNCPRWHNVSTNLRGDWNLTRRNITELTTWNWNAFSWTLIIPIWEIWNVGKQQRLDFDAQWTHPPQLQVATASMLLAGHIIGSRVSETESSAK